MLRRSISSASTRPAKLSRWLQKSSFLPWPYMIDLLPTKAGPIWLEMAALRLNFWAMWICRGLPERLNHSKLKWGTMNAIEMRSADSGQSLPVLRRT